MEEHEIDVTGPPEAALAALGRAVESWGAELEPQGAGGRLHLVPGSPAIDAGATVEPGLAADDFDGEARDDKPDIGADELK